MEGGRETDLSFLIWVDTHVLFDLHMYLMICDSSIIFNAKYNAANRFSSSPLIFSIQNICDGEKWFDGIVFSVEK